MARTLMPREIDIDAVREAVTALLGEAGYRTRAEEVAAEIAAMPAAHDVAAALVEQA